MHRPLWSNDNKTPARRLRAGVFFLLTILLVVGCRGLIGYVGILVGVLFKRLVAADEVNEKRTDDNDREYL